jgi:plastocyanin
MSKLSIFSLIFSTLTLFAAVVIFAQLSSIQERVVVVEKAAQEGSGFTFGGLPPDWTDPSNPAQSAPLEEADIPKDAIRIEATAEGFTPSTFTAQAGKKIQLAVKSADEWVHTFVFDDPNLSAVTLGLSSQQTRGITFFAPKTPGEYTFFCNVPGHRHRGEEGTMIVQ